MFNGVIIIIGIIEFFIGLTISIFSKSEKVNSFIKFLYDFDEGDEEVLPTLNKWIGENYGLVGSLYIFFASISITFSLEWFILILGIFLIEILSYTRINRGIKDILKNSQ